MKSHALKVIVAGRILDILFTRKRTPGRQGMTSREISERLNDDVREGRFSPHVTSYLKQAGGISPRLVAWLLCVMEKEQTMSLNFGFFPLPLVARRENGHAPDMWSLSPTFRRNKYPRRGGK